MTRASQLKWAVIALALVLFVAVATLVVLFASGDGHQAAGFARSSWSVVASIPCRSSWS